MSASERAITDRAGSLPPLTLGAWLRYDAVRRALRQMHGARSFVEIGCGVGALGARLAREFDYIGYEPDPVTFARARTRIPPGRVVNALLPLEPTRAFDVVAAFEVLEHQEDDVSSVRAWAEWIRPGGWMLLSVPANRNRYGEWDRAVGHFRRYNREDIAAVLTKAGLRDIDVQCYGFPLGYLLEFARHRLATRVGGDSPGERTARSGRQLQPPPWAGALTAAATWPFRIIQRPFYRSRHGIGLVAMARRPDATPGS